MKSTKKSLLLSTISLVLCFAMLLGTTWAWFTDEVKSGVNQIKAGNLDIEVSYKDGETWKSIEGVESLFSKGLWEPGHTEYVTLKIENKGSLALKYQMSVSPVTETSGTNAAGNSFKLSDYLMFGTTKADATEPTYDDRAAARAAVTATATGLNQAALSQPSKMENGAAAQYVTLVIYMPETVGNEANYRGTTAPQINLGITVVATQLTKEKDSFGPDYDAITPWLGGTDAEGLAENTNSEAKTVEIASAEQLASFAAAVNAGTIYDGYTVTLTKNIDLNNVEWIQINGAGHNITLDGNDKTIKNLKVSSGHNAGLFATGSSCTIKNLTVDGATVKGVGRIAVICGHGMCVTVESCTVKNATVTAVVTNNDDGDKAGAIVGYLSGEPNAKVTNCTVEGCTVTGYRDIGGLVGYAGGTYTVTGNTVKNSTVINDRSNNYKNYSETAFDVNAIIGEAGASGTASGNTDTNVNVVAGESIGAAVKNAISEATEGATILLPTTDEAIELPSISQKNVEIVGAVDANGNAATKVTKAGAITGDNTTVKNIVFESAPVTVGANDGIHKETGIVLDNCDFSTTKSEAMIQAYDGVTIKDCKFESNAYNARAIGWSYANGGDIVIENCEFNMSGSNMAIHLDGGDGQHKIYIRDCKFNTHIAISCGSSVKEVVVENCEIDGYINVWSDFTSKNNIYKGKTDFDFKNTGNKKFTSTGDDWSQAKETGLFYSFNNTDTIMIDGVQKTDGNRPE